jgi:hypothetical protein
MRKLLILAAVATAGSLALIVVTGAPAKPQIVRVGNLFFRDNGAISPTRLPRHEQAPITAKLNGQIGTADGTHPPAVRSVLADFDKTIQIDATGLPACGLGQLQARSTADAKKACPDSIVGSGTAGVEVAFPEQTPFAAVGPIVVFNGGVHDGTTLLYIHTYLDVPAPTAVVATVEVTHIDRGRYGLHADARIPVIGGGAGSITDFKLELGRTFTYRGEKESYLTASCPTGSYLSEGKVQFSDGTVLKVIHDLPCTPTG